MASDRETRVRNLQKKLELLECPYVENVEESWLSELLFKAGEPRLRLIQWLLERFDMVVAELFDNHQAIVSNLTDSRVAKLLFCSTLLGLCGSDDVDIITGSAKKSKQLRFFEDLVDIVRISDLFDRPPRPIDVPATPKSSDHPETLDDMFVDACKYVDVLCRQEDLKDLFQAKVHLYPPDIEKKFGKHDVETSHVPDINHLVAMAGQIGSELEKQSKTLERLQTNQSPTNHESTCIDKVSRTMGLTMSTLSQMVEGFIHCYETEMAPWSSREKPRLSELGPAFQRVSLLLEKFVKILRSLEKLKLSHDQITHLKSFDKENNLALLGATALGNLHECNTILGETVKRRAEQLDDDESL